MFLAHLKHKNISVKKKVSVKKKKETISNKIKDIKKNQIEALKLQKCKNSYGPRNYHIK